MIWWICKKELRINFLNLRIPLLLMLSLLLASIITIISCNHFQARQNDYQSRAKLFETYKSTYHINADRPPNPLSIFSNGIYLNTPVSIENPKIAFWGLETKVIEQPTDNILFTQVQYPDISYIIAIIVGLGAIILGFDSICGEKNSGTMKLALSNSVSRYQLLLGKFCAYVSMLSVIVLLVWLVSLTITISESSIQLKSEHLMFLGLSCLTSLIYVILYVIIAMLISGFVNFSRVSLMVCIAVWIVLSLLAPPFGPTVAKMVKKVPNYQRLVTSKNLLLSRHAQKSYMQCQEHARNLKSRKQVLEILHKIAYPRIDQWDKANKELSEEYQAKLRAQIELSRLLCSISPPTALQFAISELCGTSLAAQSNFEQQAGNWAKAVADNAAQQERIAIITSSEPLEMHQPIIKDLPAKQRLKNGIRYVAYMAILAIVCFAVTFVRFLRYDVR